LSSANSADLPITSRNALLDSLARGEKPRAQWRIGTEHEQFGFHLANLRPPQFDGENGIEALLTGLTRFGWQAVTENGRTIALLRDGASVSLEPAGQVELSGAALSNLHQTDNETRTYLQELAQVAKELQLGFIGMGFQPKWGRSDMPWMPKGRYEIMRNYMPKVGTLGLDMMTRTCTVQVNLDFSNEADMVKKFRLAMALQPVATALFADSPFSQGQPNGYLSYRSHIWTDTDPQRTGLLDFVFEDGFGYERYVDYLLDVPMYFVYRHGTYLDVAGQSFRDFLQGRLPALPGELPTLRDWSDHMTTAFPEVRLKQYLEMRGADSGSLERICALSAFWVGLLYDTTALDAAWDLVKGFSHNERHYLRDNVPKHALNLPFQGGTVKELAQKMLAISRQGLQRRAVLNAAGEDESQYLHALQAIADLGQTAAERKLALFHGRWQGNIDHVFTEYAY